MIRLNQGFSSGGRYTQLRPHRAKNLAISAPRGVCGPCEAALCGLWDACFTAPGMRILRPLWGVARHGLCVELPSGNGLPPSIDGTIGPRHSRRAHFVVIACDIGATPYSAISLPLRADDRNARIVHVGRLDSKLVTACAGWARPTSSDSLFKPRQHYAAQVCVELYPVCPCWMRGLRSPARFGFVSSAALEFTPSVCYEARGNPMARTFTVADGICDLSMDRDLSLSHAASFRVDVGAASDYNI